MLKRTILCVITIFAFGFSNAQDVKFGIKAGLNLSSWTGDTQGMNLRPRLGINVGGFAEIRFLDQFSIQPEILYSAQGTRFKNVGATVNGQYFKGDIKWNLSYINIPLMFKYTTNNKSYFEAGPQIGFLLSAKFRGEDIHNLYKSTDFGFNLGCGYNFTENIAVGIRYTIGLTDVNDASDEYQDYPDLYNASFKNSNFALSLAYKF